jgi:predicted MFS family arabinose efflux permease
MSRLATETGTAAPVVLALNGSVISFGQGFGAGLGGLAMQSLGFAGLALAGLAVATFVLLVNLRWDTGSQSRIGR